MRPRFVRAALAALFLAAPAALHAQGTVQVALAGIQPVLPSPFLGDVERDFRSGRFLTVVNVTGTAPVTLRFRFTLEHEGRPLVETTSAPVTLQPGTYTYRTFNESPPVLFPDGAGDLRDQLLDRLGSRVASTGVLPEGRYVARMEPLIEGTGTIGIAGTATFLVRYPSPAIPLTPADEMALATRNPVFTWTFVDAIPGAQASFELLVVEVLPTQTALEAIEGNRPILRDSVQGITSFVYTPDRLPLDTVRAYAWRLRTRVRIGGREVPVREEGLSEIRTFRVRPAALPAPTAPPAPFDIPSGPVACGVALPTLRTPATRTAASYVGTKVKLGRFDLTIEEATGTAGSLSGRGHASVPYLRAPLRVAFSGLAVNADGVAYAGNAVALPASDAAGVLPAGILGTFTGGAESMAAEKLGPAYELARGGSHLASAFAGGTPVGLPIGIDAGMTGTGWVLAVMGVQFGPGGAQANVVLDAPMPALGGSLALGARGVCLNPDGIAGDGETVLALLKEVSLTVGGVAHRFTAPAAGDEGTYAVWKGAAFDRLRLAFQTAYPRSVLVPLDGSGARREGQAVARFAATVKAGGGWIATGTLDASEIAALPGFGFGPTAVVYDNSLTGNHTGMAFPEGYESDRSAAWTGLYAPDLTLRLPEALRRFGGGRVEAAVKGLLLDGTGASLAVNLTNLIGASTPGDLGGWAYTLDRLSVQLVHSSLKRGEMAGGVRLPVGSDIIPYTALLSRATGADRLSFQFLLKPTSEVSAQVWMAKLALDPTSHISVRDTATSAGTTFRAEALLNGRLNLVGKITGFPVDFRLMRFQELGFQTGAPYVRTGTWALASPQHFVGAPGAAGGFPVELTRIAAVTRTPSAGGLGVGLAFGLKLNVPGADKWLSATTGLTTWGRITLPGSAPVIAAFDGLSLDSVQVRGEMAGVLKANGSLAFYNEDKTFGTGIGGRLQATVLKQIEARAEARFGTSLASVQYWYVDLAYASEKGIPLFSGVGLYGMGGGASRNITRTLPSQAAVMSGAGATGYTVDRNAAFELRASAVLGTHPSPNPFNADILLTATFTPSGGLNKLGLDGAGYFLTKGVTDRPSSPPAKGTVNLVYVVGPPSVFDGRFTFAINRPPATGFGSGAMYFGPDKWFVRAGNASDPKDIGLRLGLGGIGIDTHSYLYLGQDVPPLPPPPPLAPQPTMKAPSAAGGDGFGFGARTEYSFDETYLIFYASLKAGMGFDMALRGNSRCEGSPALAGIDGWYATGQAYAYLAGAVGINVDTWVYTGRLEAFKVAAGATLAGGVPNPTWMQGLVSGSYSVLGGLIEGSLDFHVELGDACRPAEGAGGALADVELVTDLRPGSSGVSVFEEPAAAFALPLDRTFTTVDHRGATRTLRVQTDGLELRLGGADGPKLAGTRRLEEDGGVLVFTPAEPLASRQRYFLRVNAYAEERGPDGRWSRLRRGDGAVVPAQERTVAFTSGDRPRTVRPGDVRYTYPVDRQRFFLAEQAREGRVQFTGSNVNYRYLQDPEQAGATVDIKMRFSPVGGGTPVDVPVTIEPGRIRFNLPALSRQSTYAMQLVRRETAPANVLSTGMGAPRVDKVGMARTQRSVGSTVNVRVAQRTLPGRRVNPGERLLFHTHFRTSEFGTLREKMAGATAAPATRSAYSHMHDVTIRMPEAFDVFDVRGTATLAPLVEYQTTIPAGQTRWMREYATPSVYNVRNRLRSTGLFGDPITEPTELIATAAAATGVLLPGGSVPRPPLSDAELMGGTAAAAPATSGSYMVPASSLAGPVLGGGMSLGSSFAVPSGPAYRFRYRWNDAVGADWRSTRGYAASAVAIYNASRVRPFDASTYQAFQRTANQPFVAPYSGAYPLRFVARLPWGGTAPSGGTGDFTFQLR